jgi:DNA-binding NarL/FixJ family response regulator
MIKVVVVDESETIREGLKTLINRTEGYSCSGSFPECSSMLKVIGKLNPNVLLIDLNLPKEESLKSIIEVKSILPDLTILILTVYEENEHIFEALLAGASGYLVKKTPSKKLIRGINDALQGGTYMSSSLAIKVMEYFNQKRAKALLVEGEILTSLENDILNRLTDGYNFKAIADFMGLSLEAVQSNYKNIYKKLHVHSDIKPLQKH